MLFSVDTGQIGPGRRRIAQLEDAVRVVGPNECRGRGGENNETEHNRPSHGLTFLLCACFIQAARVSARGSTIVQPPANRQTASCGARIVHASCKLAASSS